MKNITVKELKESLKDVPDDVEVSGDDSNKTNNRYGV